MLFGVGGGLLEIRYAPTGFLLVRAAVYRRVREEEKLPECNAQFGRPMVPYFQPLILDTPLGPWYLGEDYAFCERARRCGFKVFAETAIRLRHYGRFGYSWEDAGSIPPRYATYRFKADDLA